MYKGKSDTEVTPPMAVGSQKTSDLLIKNQFKLVNLNFSLFFTRHQDFNPVVLQISVLAHPRDMP